MTARSPAALAFALALAACGAPSDRAMVTRVLDQPGHMAVVPRSEAPPVPPPAPPPRVTPPAPPPVAAAPPPRPAPAPAARPRNRLADLTGLHADLIADRLGKPTLVQTEPPGQVWLYRHAACVLHVFLYEETGGPKVRHVETRTPGGKPPLEAEACYQAVAASAPSRALAQD